MNDVLGKLLGNPARVRLLRLFLFNPGATYTFPDIIGRSRVASATARKELTLYADIGLVRTRKGKTARSRSYTLNPSFEYLAALQHLLLNLPMRAGDIARRIQAVGAIKLVVLAGIFVDDYQGRVDLLVVGDRLTEHKLRGVVRNLEAELGRELRYVALTTDEFRYRMDIYDKLLRDVLDYPHTVSVDRLHIPLK